MDPEGIGWQERILAGLKRPILWTGLALLLFLSWITWETYQADNLGFGSKTYWDWMELLLVPAALAAAGWWFANVQKQTELEIAREENQTDREIALERQRQATLDGYLDKMTVLLLERNLGSEAVPDVKKLARARTLTVLRALDGNRNRQVIGFLQEAGLMSIGKGIELGNSDLTEVDLAWANLGATSLGGANLSRSNLVRANLRAAHLGDANLGGANLGGANLGGAFLVRANLSWANMAGTLLDRADLRLAKLKEADLSWAKLREANLAGANLRGAELRKARLEGANLEGARLEGANLQGANLYGAKAWSIDQLLKAETLEWVTMPDGSKYEVWVQKPEVRVAMIELGLVDKESP